MNPYRRLVLEVGIVMVVAWQVPTAVAQQICGEWTRVEPPAGANAITDVTASSADDAWALAGSLGTIHWDGIAWSQVALPDLSSLGSAFDLRSTASTGPGYFYAAGILQTSTWTTEQLLLIWDGSRWDQVESVELAPNIGGAPRYGSPNAIAAVAPDDVWLIGIASGSGDGVNGSPVLTVHWDGSNLTEVSTPGVGNRQNNLNDAAVIATDDIWAVGEYNSFGVGDPSFHGLTYHWDGTSWSHVANPTQNIDTAPLNAVAAIASDDVWAAGSTPDGPLFMHWDGSTWTIVPGPEGVTGTVQKLVAIATDDVWAVDSAWQVPTISKYYHWDGVAWSVVLPDIPGATSVARHGGLAAAGGCDVWATGSIGSEQGFGAFIERLQIDRGGPTAAPIGANVAIIGVAPNPFRRSAEIRFELPGDALLRARVYDVAGRLVRTLVDRSVPSDQESSWNGRDDHGRRVPVGVYFLRAQTREGRTLTQKMTMVR